MEHTPGTAQKADGFTKALPKQLLSKFQTGLGLKEVLATIPPTSVGPKHQVPQAPAASEQQQAASEQQQAASEQQQPAARNMLQEVGSSLKGHDVAESVVPQGT